MPPKKYDKNGNPFKVGWVYELYGHTLEMLSFEDWGHGNFVLVENYGALQKGKMLKLHLGDDWTLLYPGKSIATNNKAAAIFLEEEW